VTMTACSAAGLDAFKESVATAKGERKSEARERAGILNRADYQRNSTAGSLFSSEQSLLAGGNVQEGKGRAERGDRGA
jgi:hypothetical protein